MLMKPRLWLAVVLGVLLCGGTASAGIVVDSIGSMKAEIRYMTHITSTSLLPDSTLHSFCDRALLWTSVDVGGVELQYKFTLTAEQAFYAIPDSITEVLFATYISGNVTKSIKAWYPQFFEDQFTLSEIDVTASSEDDIPVAYNYWADTIQLIPAPQKADSVYLKCFVEHSDLADTGSILLKPAYTEAAVLYACHLAFISVAQFEEAALFLTLYEKKKASLRERYTRKFDLFKNE